MTHDELASYVSPSLKLFISVFKEIQNERFKGRQIAEHEDWFITGDILSTLISLPDNILCDIEALGKELSKENAEIDIWLYNIEGLMSTVQEKTYKLVENTYVFNVHAKNTDADGALQKIQSSDFLHNAWVCFSNGELLLPDADRFVESVTEKKLVPLNTNVDQDRIDFLVGKGFS